MENFSQWWSGLEPREQSMLKLGGAALLLFLIFIIGVYPAQNRIEKNEKAFQANYEDHQWLVANGPAAKAKRLGAQTQDSGQRGSIFAAVKDSLGSFGLGNASINNNNDGVRVELNNVKFDDVVRAIVKLETDHEVEVSDFRAQQESKAGMVSVRIDFQFRE